MTAIADASGDVSAEWGWPVWVFVILVALLLWAFYTTLDNRVPDLDPNETDTVDPLHCARTGHFYRLDLSREFYQCADPVCGHRVNRHGEALS